MSGVCVCVCVCVRLCVLWQPGPKERCWMAYTADIHQSEPESVHCVTLIGAMENTCGGRRGRTGTLKKAVTGSLREENWEHERTRKPPGPDTDGSSRGSSEPFPSVPEERPAGTAFQTGATSLSRDKAGPAGETITLTLPWLTEPFVLFSFIPLWAPTHTFSVIHLINASFGFERTWERETFLGSGRHIWWRMQAL